MRSLDWASSCRWARSADAALSMIATVPSAALAAKKLKASSPTGHHPAATGSPAPPAPFRASATLRSAAPARRIQSPPPIAASQADTPYIHHPGRCSNTSGATSRASRSTGTARARASSTSRQRVGGMRAAAAVRAAVQSRQAATTASQRHTEPMHFAFQAGNSPCGRRPNAYRPRPLNSLGYRERARGRNKGGRAR